MIDTAIDAGIAAFLGGDGSQSDADVRATLVAQGVQAWLAERLVVFVPLAFGRVLIPDVTFADEFIDGSVTRRLDSEPVFGAAAIRARSATRPEFERIVMRSSEFQAVNTALNEGSEPGNLVLGPVALAEPLPPAGPGDGGVPSPKHAYAELLKRHGLPVASGGLRTGEFEFDARIHPRPASSRVLVQVDFAALHPRLATGSVVESFGAFGSTWKEAIGEAIRKFERGSLHPIIATLIDRSACRDQVDWTRFAHPSGAFDLCLGSQLHLYSPSAPTRMGPVLDALLDALKEVPLSRDVHSLRVYTCHQDGDLTDKEVRLDNQPWPAGEAIVAGADWAAGDGLVGSRLFGLLSPTN